MKSHRGGVYKSIIVDQILLIENPVLKIWVLKLNPISQKWTIKRAKIDEVIDKDWCKIMRNW